MNKECDKFTNQILSQTGKLDNEAKVHLENCENCKVMFESWQALKNIKTSKKIPISADFIIKREAQRVAMNRSSINTSFKRWFTLATAAACAVFVLWLIIVQLKHQQKQQELTKPTAMETLIVNNFQTSQKKQVKSQLNNYSSQNIDWQNLDLNNDFFEIESEMEYYSASI